MSLYESQNHLNRDAPGNEAGISEHTDYLFDSVQISSTDCHGMMRHILDCLGAVRVRAKLDHKLTQAGKEIFKGACLKFLDAIVDNEDETHEDGSAVPQLMNVFPDERKRRDGRSWLPLHWAASLDELDEENVKSIARDRPIWAKSGHSANTNSMNSTSGAGLLPFHFISSLKHPRINNMKTILSLYPEAIRLPDKHDWLPIHYGAFNCMDQEAVRFLMDMNSEGVQAQTDKGQLPLLLSCHNKRVDIFEDLLDSNPDAVDGMDLQGNTCLHYSSKYCNPDCAKRVIEVNPDLSTQSNFLEELPVHQAFEFIKRDDKRSRWRQLELLRIILDENPETVSQKDSHGNLPLHLAVGFNASYEVCEVLYNIYPSAALIADGDGNLPVSYCSKDQVELQNLLFGARNKPLQKMGFKSSFASFSVPAEQRKELREGKVSVPLKRVEESRGLDHRK